jgi:hypothetical protein
MLSIIHQQPETPHALSAGHYFKAGFFTCLGWLTALTFLWVIVLVTWGYELHRLLGGLR